MKDYISASPIEALARRCFSQEFEDDRRTIGAGADRLHLGRRRLQETARLDRRVEHGLPASSPPHDLRLELVYAADARDQVAQMVRGEQACCGFLSFEIRDEPDAVRVVIEAPEAAREAAAMVFEPFQSKAPNETACGSCGATS